MRGLVFPCYAGRKNGKNLENNSVGFVLLFVSHRSKRTIAAASLHFK